MQRRTNSRLELGVKLLMPLRRKELSLGKTGFPLLLNQQHRISRYFEWDSEMNVPDAATLAIILLDFFRILLIAQRSEVP